jgi:tellurite resistance protein TerC
MEIGGHGVVVWIVFHVLIFVLLGLDLGVVNRKPRVMAMRESIFWNVVWTSLGLAFGLVIAWLYGRPAMVEYTTGYLIERALSVDNIFVFVIAFRYFQVPAAYQHRILYWGILGALVMRGALIVAGAAVVTRFHWVLYVFGAFLVYTGLTLIFKAETPPDPEHNWGVRLARRLLPITPKLHGQNFFVRVAGRWHGTPLLIVLAVVETTDLVFALDSIPAIFGVTRDPFIIYTSNVFAILGLRTMYFLLAALLPKFRFLNYGLSLILVFIGARMLADKWVHIATETTLLLVVGVLAVSIVASLAIPERGRDDGV